MVGLRDFGYIILDSGVICSEKLRGRRGKVVSICRCLALSLSWSLSVRGSVFDGATFEVLNGRGRLRISYAYLRIT